MVVHKTWTTLSVIWATFRSSKGSQLYNEGFGRGIVGFILNNRRLSSREDPSPIGSSSLDYPRRTAGTLG